MEETVKLSREGLKNAIVEFIKENPFTTRDYIFSYVINTYPKNDRKDIDPIINELLDEGIIMGRDITQYAHRELFL